MNGYVFNVTARDGTESSSVEGQIDLSSCPAHGVVEPLATMLGLYRLYSTVRSRDSRLSLRIFRKGTEGTRRERNVSDDDA